MVLPALTFAFPIMYVKRRETESRQGDKLYLNSWKLDIITRMTGKVRKSAVTHSRYLKSRSEAVALTVVFPIMLEFCRHDLDSCALPLYWE